MIYSVTLCGTIVSYNVVESLNVTVWPRYTLMNGASGYLWTICYAGDMLLLVRACAAPMGDMEPHELPVFYHEI